MWKEDPAQLRIELRDAVRGHNSGQLTNIVQLPSGFAVLKILPDSPAMNDLNPKRISSLIETGAIRIGPLISGVTEANLAFQAYALRSGWDARDLRRTCEIQNKTQKNTKTTKHKTKTHKQKNKKPNTETHLRSGSSSNR